LPFIRMAQKSEFCPVWAIFKIIQIIS